MKTYFSYLYRTLIKRASIWIVFGIYWLCNIVILLIVPGVTKISPITLWSTDIVSLQGLFVLIVSVVSAVVVVFTFRASIEDETELVIVSKPLKRWKINLVKFIWVLIAAVFLALVTSVISLFTMCFGKYDPVTNAAGMMFDKMPALIGSICLGTIIVSLIYDSFGILVSMVGNKVQILVAIITTTIVLTVYNTISDFILTPLNAKMESKIGSKLTSFKAIDSEGNSYSYAYTYNQPNDDLYSLYEENSQLGNQIFEYFNFLAQQANLYQAFDVNDLKTNLGSMPFGAKAAYKTTIKSKDDTMSAYLQNEYENANKDHFPLVLPYSDWIFNNVASTAEQQTAANAQLTFLGPKTEVLFAMKYAGAKPESIYVSNSAKLLGIFPSHWLTGNELYVSEEFEKDVFDKITYRLFTETSPTFLPNPQWYRDIMGPWDWVTDKAEQQPWQKQQLVFNGFFEMCYDFMKENQSKYDLNVNKENDINDSYAKIQYALTKQFCLIYWDQIIDQVCNDLDIDFITYISNADPDEDNKTSFVKGFTSAEKLKINNPYTGDPILNGSGQEEVNFNLLQFLRMAFGYSSICNFVPTTGISLDGVNIGAYSSLGKDNTIFAGSYAHIKNFGTQKYKDTDGWGFDYTDANYSNSTSMIYNAMAGNIIDTEQNVHTDWGIDNMYKYEVNPFVTINVSIVLWVTVSLILVLTAAVMYQRADIK